MQYIAQEARNCDIKTFVPDRRTALLTFSPYMKFTSETYDASSEHQTTDNRALYFTVPTSTSQNFDRKAKNTI